MNNVKDENGKKCIGHVRKYKDRMWDLDKRVDVIPAEPLVIDLDKDFSGSEILMMTSLSIISK